MANLSASVWYLDSAQYANVAAWASLTSYPVGSLVRQLTTPAVNSERVFVQVTPTTHVSGASEPTWTTTFQGNTPSDGTCSWYEATGRPEVNGDLSNALTWALQHALSTTVTAGQLIYDSVTASTQIVTTGGTIGSSAPSFSATAGVTTADNTATWTSLGLASAFSTWKAPHARLANAFTTNWAKAGNTIFVGDDHAETQASAITITGPGTPAAPCQVYCVDHTASVPPGVANLKTTAMFTGTTGNITLAGNTYFNGVNVIQNATTSSLILVAHASVWNKFENSSLQLGPSAGSGSQIVWGSSSGNQAIKIELVNTTLSFSNVGQSTVLNEARFSWKNTPSALIGTAVPTTLFSGSGGNGALASEGLVEGVDLGAAGSGKTLVGSVASAWRMLFKNCLTNPAVTVAAAPGGQGYAITDVINSDSSGTTYQQLRFWYQGTLTPATAIVRTGGASDGVTPISWNISTTANSQWISPFESFPIPIWNTTLSTNRGVTAYGIWNSAGLPNNDQIWLDAEYQGSASSPLGSLATQTKANGLAAGAALTADSTSTWSSAATARANSTLYTTGQSIAVPGASGGGGLFFCTSGGTSGSSQPGGYASAADGGSVTDGTATFRAGVRFVLNVTLSSPQPALVGAIYGTIKVAQPSSTFYVDPRLTLS